MGSLNGMDAIALKHRISIWHVRHAAQQKWYQGGFVCVGYLRKERRKVVCVLSTVIGRHLHAHYDHAGSCSFCSLQHRIQIGACHRQWQATQGVIATEFDDDDAGLMPR